MKNNLFFSLVLCLIFLLSACNNVSIKHGAGKDTKDFFGDGTYQVLHQTDKSGSHIEQLFNCEYNQCFLTEIYGYLQNDNYVYLAGNYNNRNAYCKLNVKNNFLTYYAENGSEELVMVYLYDMLKEKQVRLCSSWDDFSKEEKKIFEKIEAD